jgi:hypothetical protein
MADLKQQAAMPLSSFLRRDPWTDQLITLHTAYEPLLSPADKMPFELTPVYIKLSYYKPPAETPAPPAGAAAPGNQQAPGAGTPAPAENPEPPAGQTAPATGTANPPQEAAPAGQNTPATGTANPPQN